MPAAMQYLPDDKAQREAADEELKARQALYSLHAAYYDGKHRRPLKDPADNVVINLQKQAEDRAIAFLFPEAPRLEMDEQETTDDEAFLMEAWEENGGAGLLGSLAHIGARAGSVFVRLVEHEPYPRIVPLNPARVIAFWDGDDYERVLWYEIRWTVGKAVYRQDILEDMPGRWVILEYKQEASRWIKTDEIYWSYPLGPIQCWQHMPALFQFYGQHDYGNMALNDAVNKVASDVKRILRFHAFPRTVGTGFEASKVQETGIDGFWTIPNENARVQNLEMQSDLSSSLQFMDTLTQAFLHEQRVVMVPGGLDAFKGMTNLGIRAAFMDMVSKNEVLRRQYGRAIQQISQRLLMMADRPFEVPPVVHWSEALPVDRREMVALTQQEILMGTLSVRSASAELGRDYLLEQERRADEQLTSDVMDGGATVGVSG